MPHMYIYLTCMLLIRSITVVTYDDHFLPSIIQALIVCRRYRVSTCQWGCMAAVGS